jgi:phosphomannomutase
MRKSDKLKNIQKANMFAEQRFIETTDITERTKTANKITDIVNDNPFIKSYIDEILKTIENNNIHKSNVKNVRIQLIQNNFK